MIKQIFTLATLIFMPILAAAVYAASFLDEIPFYYDNFGIVLAICGLLYLITCPFFKKKRFKLFMYLLLIGAGLFLAGIIIFICFYGYAFTTPETEGGWYF
ncbi:hypothetical protein SAMN04488505_109126 [Chitinophaga rupis]|uniref:Uncharacterized protein n=1 Tax=Chitinophaga rupis TaxID=573321 RepID=A0A1H8F7P3_9BACT|nr:hypothetical protein [Chitinophaga rupis]SEN27665.1 hypothetical protein SAMN04488505_109126 [Chitinophaga rupis]